MIYEERILLSHNFFIKTNIKKKYRKLNLSYAIKGNIFVNSSIA